jgi:hypothetical protein
LLAGDYVDGRSQVLLAEERFQAAGEWLIDEQRVELHRYFGHAHAVAFR